MINTVENFRVFQNSGPEPIVVRSVSLGLMAHSSSGVASHLCAYASPDSNARDMWVNTGIFYGQDRIYLVVYGREGSSISDRCRESVHWTIPVGGSFWISLRGAGTLDNVAYRGSFSTLSDPVQVSNGVDNPVPVDPFSWS